MIEEIFQKVLVGTLAKNEFNVYYNMFKNGSTIKYLTTLFDADISDDGRKMRCNDLEDIYFDRSKELYQYFEILSNDKKASTIAYCEEVQIKVIDRYNFIVEVLEQSFPSESEISIHEEIESFTDEAMYWDDEPLPTREYLLLCAGTFKKFSNDISERINESKNVDLKSKDWQVGTKLLFLKYCNLIPTINEQTSQSTKISDSIICQTLASLMDESTANIKTYYSLLKDVRTGKHKVPSRFKIEMFDEAISALSKLGFDTFEIKSIRNKISADS
jgi:hypothetical protein